MTSVMSTAPVAPACVSRLHPIPPDLAALKPATNRHGETVFPPYIELLKIGAAEHQCFFRAMEEQQKQLDAYKKLLVEQKEQLNTYIELLASQRDVIDVLRAQSQSQPSFLVDDFGAHTCMGLPCSDLGAGGVQYAGEWLPEPSSMFDAVALDDSVSTALAPAPPPAPTPDPTPAPTLDDDTEPGFQLVGVFGKVTVRVVSGSSRRKPPSELAAEAAAAATAAAQTLSMPPPSSQKKKRPSSTGSRTPANAQVKRETCRKHNVKQEPKPFQERKRART